MENQIDYLGIVGSSLGPISTPDEVQATYNDTTDHQTVLCQTLPGASVNDILNQLPDNRGKMTAQYTMLTKFFQTMAQKQ